MRAFGKQQKKFFLVTLFACTFLFVCSAFFALSAAAAFTPTINYQGKLTDATSSAVPDGSYDMAFSLYTASTGGSPVWTETLTGANQVPVTSGLFSVMLGSVTPLTNVNFNQTLYLGVTVGSDAEMTPRKILGTVPAAFEADNAQTLDDIATSSFLRSDQADSIAASTASTLLSITQNGSGNILSLFDGTTEVFSVLDGGNVGIGTINPDSLLTLGQAATSSTLSFSQNADYDAGEEVGRIAFRVNAGGVEYDMVKITAETTALNENRADLLFHTGESGEGVERMRITSDGNVGIGTSSPQAKLHILDTGIASIRLTDDSSLDANWELRVGDVLSPSTGNAFAIWGGVEGSEDQRLTIDANGYVGIGTTTPNEELSVYGDLGEVWTSVGTGSFSSKAGIKLYENAFIRGGLYADGSNNGLALFGGATPEEQLFVDVDGNVGIGTSTPSATLAVDGDAYINGALTLAGGATTTILGNIGISGSIIPSADITYDLGSPTRQWRDEYIGPGSLYINGKKVIQDVSDTITISTDINQNLAIETDGIGSILTNAEGSGNVSLLAASGNININSTSGNLNIGTTGSGQLNLGTVTSGVWQGTTVDTSDYTNLSVTATGLELSADAVALSSGYAIPLNASTTQWQTAYSWGDHSTAGYLTDITSESLEDLSDVSAMTQGTGDLLSWNGTNWTNVATSTLGISSGASFTNSSELAALLSDETGTGKAVFSNAPTLAGVTNTGNGTAAGYFFVGSNGVPTNTTAGDLTATRLSIGNGTLSSGAGSYANLEGTMTDTSTGAVTGASIQTTISPTSNSDSAFRSLNMSNMFNTAFNFTAAGGSSPTAGWFENRVVNIGDVAGLNGITSMGLIAGTAAASLGTVTTVNSVYAMPVNSFGNALTGTITNAFGIRAVDSSNDGSGPLTITNQVGVGIGTLTAGTNNTSLLISSNIPTGNYAIYNASVHDNYFAGNLGIGTTDPAYLLDLTSTANVPTLNINGDTAAKAGIRISNTGTGGSTYRITAGTFGAENSMFNIYDDEAALNRLTIDTSGNVGIGTTNPSSKLDVAGDVEVSGDLIAEVANQFALGFQHIAHPESEHPLMLPYLQNDIAFNTEKGGSASSTPFNGGLDNAFNGKAEHVSFLNPTSTIAVEVDLWKTFLWNSQIGFSMSGGWRAKDFTIEYHNPVTDEWETAATETNYAYGQYVVQVSNDADGIDKLRFTFSNFNSATIFRISSLFLVNYASDMGTATFLSRGGGEVFGATNLATLSGNVSIGTTTADARLSVYSSGGSVENTIRATNATFGRWIGFTTTSGVNQYIEVDGGPVSDATLGFMLDDTVEMIIDDSGNVGIGTTTPARELDVFGDVLIENSSGETNLRLAQHTTGGRNWELISGGSSGAFSGGKFGIYDQTAGVARLTIDASGNVGIGTTSPSAKLEVDGGVSGTDILRLVRESNANPSFSFSASGNDALLVMKELNAGTTWSTGIDTSNEDSFQISQNATFGTNDYFTIVGSGGNAGNVGIGTISPSEELEVAGTVRASAFELGASTFQYSIGALQSGEITPNLLGQYADHYQNATVIDAEYWDGGAWVDWSSKVTDLQLLFNGSSRDKVTIPAVNNDFRFVFQTNDTFPSGGLVQIYQEWVTGGPSAFDIVIERSVDSAFTTTTTLLDTNFGADTYFNNAFVTDHAGETYYRVRITVDETKDTSWVWLRHYTSRLSEGRFAGLPFMWQGANADVSFDGNIGINNTSPEHALTVGENALYTAEGQVASFFEGNDTALSILSNTNNNGAGPRLRLFENNAAKYGTELFYDSGANDFSIVNYANNVETGRIHLDGGSGNVGIGDATPQSLLTVGNGDAFQVDSSGRIGSGVAPGSSNAQLSIARTSSDALSAMNDSAVTVAYTDASSGETLTTSRVALDVAYNKTGTSTHTSWIAGGVRSTMNLDGGTVGDARGFTSRIEPGGNSTTTNITHFLADSQFSGADNSTTTNRYGFRVKDFNGDGNQKLFNQYGVFVDDFNDADDNYAIYTAGDTQSFFGGNVGIGAAVPSEKLHLAGADDINLLLQADTDNAGEAGHPQIQFSQDGGAVTSTIGYIDDNELQIMNNYVDGDLHLGTAGSKKLTILANGNVGIGTTTPNQLFQVQTGASEYFAVSTGGSGFSFPADASSPTHGFGLSRTSDGAYSSLVFAEGVDAENLGIKARSDIRFYGNQDLNVIFKETGNVGIGTTTPSSLLAMDKSGLTGSVIAGIHQNFNFTNATEDAVMYGDNTYIVNAPTATSTLVGNILRIEDSSALGNTVRGFEVQAHRGANTQGENTAISGFGRTFGVRGTTEGDAGGVFQPAGIFAETRGTSQGNALRAYSSSITTEDLVSLFQDTSTFTGTGLVMNFGNSGGSFSGGTSNFVDFQNAGTSKFTVGAHGMTTIGDGTTNNNVGLQVGYGGICVDNDGTCTASTAGKITSVSSGVGNSDLAEMYFSGEVLEAGDIVYTKGALSIGKADEDAQGAIIGVVSTKPGLTLGYDDSPLTQGKTGYPVALSGRVPIKLSTENGPIKEGDEIMLSSIPGVGMKAKGSGTIVGIALEDYDGDYAYSEGFIDQFGDDIAVPDTDPLSVEEDERINDGCYFGGGGALGEEACDPKDVERFERIQKSSFDAHEDKLDELYRLAHKEAKPMQTPGGEEVEVGRALMFVNLGWHASVQESVVLKELTSTSTDLVLGGDGEQTLWSRIKTLAQNFVNGVLTVLDLRADNVYVENELCVDGVCITSDDLRALLQEAGQPENGSGEYVPPQEPSTPPEEAEPEEPEEPDPPKENPDDELQQPEEDQQDEQQEDDEEIPPEESDQEKVEDEKAPQGGQQDSPEEHDQTHEDEEISQEQDVTEEQLHEDQEAAEDREETKQEETEKEIDAEEPEGGLLEPQEDPTT